jgi:SAM-dependent methyltransferase
VSNATGGEGTAGDAMTAAEAAVPGEAAERLRFFGLFATLHDMKLPRTRVLPVYSGYFATLYDALSQDYTWDLPLLSDLVAGGPKTILELGCGNGRLTVPLARSGHHVVGVDSSPDMLTLLRRKLSAAGPDVAARVELVQRDMRDFRLGRRFDLVLLPANNLSLLASPEDRAAVFRQVRDHLGPGGRFVFDVGQLEPERLLRQNQDLSVVPASSPSAAHFIFSAHRYFPDEQVQVMNFYVERVMPDGTTDRFLGSWTKAVFGEAHVADLIGQASLTMVDAWWCEPDAEHRRMKMYVCAAARRPGRRTIG